ncbi:MAG: hypothetical protein K2V38_06070, partial [Gemmataceae bacterium]|nr:hypothetical protein [Gemmataceae bacterium]
MTEWTTLRRFGALALLLTSLLSPAPAFGVDEPREPKNTPAKPTPAQLRELAARAEKAGDWEAAFNAYCHLFVADRNAADLRDKLNHALRHVQQIRRHREPGFQQFAAGMPLDGGLDLFAEVLHKVSTLYADRDKAAIQNLWAFAVEEIDRALGSPTFRQLVLDNSKAEKLDPFRASLR